MAPFEVMFGVIPRIAGKQYINALPIGAIETSRLFEIVTAKFGGTERMLPLPVVYDGPRFKVGDQK